MPPSDRGAAMSAVTEDGLDPPAVRNKFDGTALQAGKVMNSIPKIHTSFFKSFFFISSSSIHFS
jgi:hypothetical protein